MPEQVQNILNKILEWWKKFNTKQKALLISLTSVVLLALVILAVVMTRPTYVSLYDAADNKEAAAIKKLLDSDGTLDYKVSGTTHFEINAKQESEANMLLGTNDYATNGYNLSKADLSKVVNGSFSTTEADKQKLYKDYLETKLAEDLAAQDLIESATVSLDIADDDGTLISRMQESSASVSLRLTGSISDTQAYSIARFVATQLGNDSTDKVTIIDQKTSKIIYSGADQDSDLTLLSSQLDEQERRAASIKSDIKDALAESGLFSNVEVGLNLDMSFQDVEDVVHTYWHNEGMDNGEITSQEIYSASGTGDVGGVPGTYSNSDNTSYYTGGTDGEWSVSNQKTLYSPNEEIKTTTSKGGTINRENCSAAVVAVRNVVYEEDVLKASGALEDMSWDEYKAANGDNRLVENEEEMASYVSMVAKVVGCDESAVEFLCIEKPIFVDSEGNGRTLTDILQIALAVLIFALLGFVVFRSTRKQKETEPEPELSVEALLESTAEAEDELEDIGYSEKSETRILIEKFVDEKPDAAALLLRNWLNEDWE
ncbi:MAG: flagellar M-ring protein FliF C-terminal domain-containing protein [Lachnospiraceae bacterium]|nr:flagellar M-ring protein FliF C-terminal domain-containing protein [Lachnospiraceae bacterium]MDY5521211.1 flagellar M-ring protein FliF C-terminal domain-containing protein [Agathobacter sp.]